MSNMSRNALTILILLAIYVQTCYESFKSFFFSFFFFIYFTCAHVCTCVSFSFLIFYLVSCCCSKFTRKINKRRYYVVQSIDLVLTISYLNDDNFAERIMYLLLWFLIRGILYTFFLIHRKDWINVYNEFIDLI